MRSAPRFAFALLVSLTTIPTLAPVARAHDPEPEVSSQPARSMWDRMIAAEIVGGIDTPWGLFGGAVIISPIRNLQFDVGGGVSRDGGRVTGGARLVLPHEHGALGLRAGFAGGPLTWEVRAPDPANPAAGDAPFVTQRRSWDFVGFFDVSLSLEVRFDEGMYARLMFGVEHALAGADRCTEHHADGTTSACGSGDAGGGGVPGGQPTRTYLGLALGYAFDL